MSSAPTTWVNHYRGTPSFVAATRIATFDTDSVMSSFAAMVTASRNGITRRSAPGVAGVRVWQLMSWARTGDAAIAAGGR
jgi:hypothetical protein